VSLTFPNVEPPPNVSAERSLPCRPVERWCHSAYNEQLLFSICRPTSNDVVSRRRALRERVVFSGRILSSCVWASTVHVRVWKWFRFSSSIPPEFLFVRAVATSVALPVPRTALRATLRALALFADRSVTATVPFCICASATGPGNGTSPAISATSAARAAHRLQRVPCIAIEAVFVRHVRFVVQPAARPEAPSGNAQRREAVPVQWGLRQDIHAEGCAETTSACQGLRQSRRIVAVGVEPAQTQ